MDQRRHRLPLATVFNRRIRMWNLQTSHDRNQQLAQAYRARTTPRQRLVNRLRALQRTSEEVIFILSAFDTASLDTQITMADETAIADLLPCRPT
jgi:hypothetical protein